MLHSIEAAARLGNFTEAAQELNLTQGAVSRQIQELEQLLAVKLFERSGPKLKLTETGRVFAAGAARALNVLREAVLLANEGQNTTHVTLSMLPSVASKWLAPRLGRFIDQHPDIDLRVSASRQLVNFEDKKIDAAIRYGKGNWRGLDAEQLGMETVFPVCTPAYAKSHGLTKPSHLVDVTLLHADIEEDWLAWFEKAGVSIDQIPRGPRLGDANAILQAVIEGHGVALGRSTLVADELATGRLIAPFKIELKASCSYWFVMPSTSMASPNLLSVKEWVQSEFNKL